MAPIMLPVLALNPLTLGLLVLNGAVIDKDGRALMRAKLKVIASCMRHFDNVWRGGKSVDTVAVY